MARRKLVNDKPGPLQCRILAVVEVATLCFDKPLCAEQLAEAIEELWPHIRLRYGPASVKGALSSMVNYQDRQWLFRTYRGCLLYTSPSPRD